MSSKKKGSKTAARGATAVAEKAPTVSAEVSAAAAAAAATAAGEAAVAAGQAAAAAAAAVASVPATVNAPAPIPAPASIFQFPSSPPAPTYKFTDASTNAEITSVINDISEEDSAKKNALKMLSASKLCSLLSDAAISAATKKSILDLLDYGGLTKIILATDAIPQEMLEEVGRRIKRILQASSMRRRPSTTNLAGRTKELFATVLPNQRNTCYFKPVLADTLYGMCETFPVIQFAGLSQFTAFVRVTSKEMEAQLHSSEPVAIITHLEPLTGRGGHFNAYIRAGTSWYDADNSHAVLRERKYGQPTWRTVPLMSRTKVGQMIYCYADTSKIPPRTGMPAPQALHGHPTFAQDGMGSCSIDAFASVLCFADGFRDIMATAMSAGIEQIVLKHMGHAREKVIDVPACLADVEALIASKLIAQLSGPIFSQQRPPRQENFLPITTAAQGSMFFSKEHRVPSSELLTRIIKYLAGTAIRFHGIRLEAGLGHVEIPINASWGIKSKKILGPKGRVLPAMLKRSKRNTHRRQFLPRPGMAEKATRRNRTGAINRMALHKKEQTRRRKETRSKRLENRIMAKRRS